MMLGELLDMSLSFRPDGWQAVGRERGASLEVASLGWRKEEPERLVGRSSPLSTTMSCHQVPQGGKKTWLFKEGPEWLSSHKEGRGQCLCKQSFKR